VQLDAIKPTLKAPGSMLLKLKHDKPLSNFAVTFNLRRYTMDFLARPRATNKSPGSSASGSG
jgi:hypothetical protein